MRELLRRCFSTKNQIIVILFFTYIYDLVRQGFIETRKRQLQILRATASSYYTNDGLADADHSLYSRLGQQQLPPPAGQFSATREAASVAASLAAADDGAGCYGLLGEISPIIKHHSHGQLPEKWIELKACENLLEFGDCSWQLLRREQSLLPNRPRQPPVAPPNLTNRPAKASNGILAPARVTDWFCGGGVSGGGETIASSRSDQDDVQAKHDCPLKEMPRPIRCYQYLSHFLVLVSFIKYCCLVIFDNELFGSKQSFSCYIPGRTAILPQLSPGFSFIVLFYHVIYRFYLCIARKSAFHLDCFIFLLYEEQTIGSLESNHCDKLARCGHLLAANRFYAMNSLFFVKVHLRGQPDRVIYRTMTNRNLEHWLKLKRFFNCFILICLGNLAFWSIPLSVAIILVVLSPENFGVIYGNCDAMVFTNLHNWSLLDGRQLIWFLGDLIDSCWLLFDTANALVWPFASMVFCAQDLNITIDKLDETVNELVVRLKNTLNMITNKCWSEQAKSTRTRQLMRSMKSIELDIFILQSEIARMLQQIHQVDEFMSRISAFCIFVWIFTNLFLQIMSLRQNKILLLDVVIQFMQLTALIALTLSFAYIAQVNTKTRRLYRGMCNLAALDPNYKTSKSSWLCVLEYFNKDKPSYSFRLGPFTQLTLANYFKACSWLITGALITIQLFKYKYGIQD